MRDRRFDDFRGDARRGVAAVVLSAVLAVGVAPAGAAPARPAAPQAPGAPAAPAQAAALPTLSGVEFRELYNRYEPWPNTTKLTSAPAITGHAGADARIRSLASARGYRLRSQHTGARVTVLGVPLDQTAAGQLNALAARARAAGHYLGAGYGYRSVDLQRSIFNRRIAGYSGAAIAQGRADGAIEAALRWVAIPGHSKHQTGMAVDLRAAGGASFGGSAVGRWMAADNYQVAKEYGFIPSYPPGAGLQGPDPEPWEFTYVGRKAIECAVPLVRHNDRIGFESCMGNSPIARRYAALGGAKGVLGPVTISERATPEGKGRVGRYQHGNIYWSAATGAHEVRKPLLHEYGNQGASGGVLRFPTSGTRVSGDRRSTYNNFERGRIYDRGTAGVIAVPAPYFAKHEAFGGIYGLLGYPTGRVRATSDGAARYQDYVKGRIYERGGRAAEVHGAVFTLHQATGGPAGTFGYPVTDLNPAGDGRGKAQWFDRVLVLYAPTAGAHGIGGDVLQRFAANGGVRGYLRYPTSGTVAVGDGRGTVTRFEKGRIYDSATTGAFQVHGAVLDAYLAEHGGPTGALGYPLSDLAPAGTPGGRVQQFEGGTLRFNASGTVTLLP